MWHPSFEKTDYEVLDTKVLYSGHYKVVKHTLRFKQFDGQWSPTLEREQIIRRGAVCLVLFDKEEQALLLVEQFRLGLVDQEQSPWMLELVAGIIDEGEAPEDTARREALEEAGCHLNALFPILSCHPTPGGFSEFTHLFYAPITFSSIDWKQTRGLLHEGEDIRLHRVPLSDAKLLVQQGKITTATTQLGIQWILLNRDHLPK